MERLSCNVLVIGAGPAGYVCAIRCGQLGLDTIIVEKERPGGTCLNVGCIPSKALIHAGNEFHRLTEAANSGSTLGLSCADPQVDFAKTQDWKDGIVSRLNSGVASLLKKAKVRAIPGEARFVDGKTVDVKTPNGEVRIRAERVVIATGSEPIPLSSLAFSDDVMSSTQALALDHVPHSLAVVGAGYIGLELGTALAKLGAKVTIIDAAAQILPQYDSELTAPVAERLKGLGITVLTGTKVLGRDGKSLQLVPLQDKDSDSGQGASQSQQTLDADKVLVAVGRKPVTSNLGLDRLALEFDGPFIKIDPQCQTAMRGVYAIGDVTGEPMLAHRAMAQGELVAEILAGQPASWDKQAIPAVCFTDPEIVSVGLSPADLPDLSEFKIAKFPFKANGRAMTAGDEAGFIRILAQAHDHRVVGVQAVGAHVAEMSAGFASLIEMNARLEDIGDTIHAHPTHTEALQEAALTALGRPLHM